MARLHGRALGLGIAVLALIGATSAYAIAPSSRSKPPVSVARYAAAEGQSRSGSETRFGGLAQAGAPVVKLGAPPPPPPKCTFNGAPIACNTAQGWWDGVDNCYWNQMPPPLPPATAPAWMGNSPANGTLYNISCPANLSANLGFTNVGVAFDSQPPPGYNGQPQVLAQVEALQAILNTNLLGPIVGTAPQAVTPTTPNSVGLVGEPVWLWQEPTILTWGPLNPGLANIGGTTLLGLPIPAVGVGLDALGARLDWHMGDGPNGGTVVPCPGLSSQFPPLAMTQPPGTSPLNTLLGALLGLLNPLFSQPKPPPVPKGTTVSPNCGYRYAKPGTYTVTAAATWNVNWAVGANHGSISIIRYTTLQLKIDELQVVVQ